MTRKLSGVVAGSENSKVLPGCRFGGWTVLGPAPIWTTNRDTQRRLCVCDCGTFKVVYVYTLIRGESQSCGCLTKTKISNAVTKHGGSHTVEHNAWTALNGRCYNPRNKRYPLYGERGIRVADRWRGTEGFQHFLEDMGFKPTPKHSIDRTDVNGDYSPENCKWASHTEQMRNMRHTQMVEYQNKTLSLAEWCERLNIDLKRTDTRLARGWTVQEAFTIPKLNKRVFAGRSTSNRKRVYV